MTYEITDRTQLAAFIRHARLTGTFRSYGRLSPFGRSLTTTTYQIYLSGWTFQPPMNIHRVR